MKQVRRFDFNRMTEFPEDGGYVFYTDYKEVLDTLKKVHIRSEMVESNLMKIIEELRYENSKLKEKK